MRGATGDAVLAPRLLGTDDMSSTPVNDGWPIPRAGQLLGLRVAVSGDGAVDRTVELLEREGATCHQCPPVGPLEGSDPAALERWLRMLAASPPDSVIFLSAEGVHQVLAAASRLGLLHQVQSALSRVRLIARGTRTACTMQALCLAPALFSVAASTRELMDCLRGERLEGRRVGLQLAGRDPAHQLRSFLEARGATVASVAPHGCIPTSAYALLLELVDGVLGGEIDACVFTSAAQVSRLRACAEEHGRCGLLALALNTISVVGIGGGTVFELRGLGVRSVIELDRRFFLRRLAATLQVARVKTGVHEGRLPPLS